MRSYVHVLSCRIASFRVVSPNRRKKNEWCFSFGLYGMMENWKSTEKKCSSPQSLFTNHRNNEKKKTKQSPQPIQPSNCFMITFGDNQTIWKFVFYEYVMHLKKNFEIVACVYDFTSKFPTRSLQFQERNNFLSH